MSLGELASKQACVEDMVTRSLAELRAEVAAAKVTSPDISSRLAAVEQRISAFEKHVVPVLSSMRSQLAALDRAVDRLETRGRQDCLLFKGVPESSEMTPRLLVEDTLRNKFGIGDSSTLISSSRLGLRAEGTNRPILVRFSNCAIRNQVWQQRSKLKGCPISLGEFLTKPRQETFSRARKYYGMRSCWTADGRIFIKIPDGTKHSVCNMSELQDLINQHPVVSGDAPAAREVRDETKSAARPKRSTKVK